MAGEWDDVSPKTKEEASKEALQSSVKPDNNKGNSFSYYSTPLEIRRLIQQALNSYDRFIKKPVKSLFNKLKELFYKIPKEQRNGLGYDPKTLRTTLIAAGESSKKGSKNEHRETRRIHMYRQTICASARRA